MKIQQIDPETPSSRATRLGLQSSRFYQKHMSKHAEQAIDYVKKKDRSSIQLKQWRNLKFYKKDSIKQLFNCPDDIERRNVETLSVEQFVQTHERGCKPVIIRGITKDWNIKEKWTHEYFYKKYKDYKFKIGEDDEGYKLRVPFKYYLEYLIYNKDDSPLYLFQSSLEDKEETRPIIENYRVPDYFKDDLFKLAGEKKRPPYRWFIMGPQRSGTTVHIDPLMTSAWNASLAGHKRWVIFTQNLPKSIVKGKQFRNKHYQDQAINYFTQILPKIKQKYKKQHLGLVEFIQYPGETVFVPGGQYHAVINLDQTIAVTQNVMTHYGFDKVWRSTRCERRKFAKIFLQRLKDNDTELYNRAIALNQKDKFQMGNKYCEQSVSMSFTPTSESSSSSSSDSSDSSDSLEDRKSVKKGKNKVMMGKKRSNCNNSRSVSRSRDRKKRETLSEQRHTTKTKKNRMS